MSKEFDRDMKKIFGFLKTKTSNKKGWFEKIIKHIKRD